MVLVILGKYIMIMLGKCVSVKGPMADASVTYMFSIKSHLITSLWFLSDTKVFHASDLREEVHDAYLTLLFDKAFESLQYIFSYSKYLFLIKMKPRVLPL